VRYFAATTSRTQPWIKALKDLQEPLLPDGSVGTAMLIVPVQTGNIASPAQANGISLL
jgi:hypothetical protein